jgi:uncharacterized membrane protein YidH (DUF202 family)
MTFKDLVFTILGIFDEVITIIIGIAVLVFLYGMLNYVMHSDDESKRKESVKFITYGIIGLFVMVSVWGLVAAITGTFGFEFGIPQLI